MQYSDAVGDSIIWQMAFAITWSLVWLTILQFWVTHLYLQTTDLIPLLWWNGRSWIVNGYSLHAAAVSVDPCLLAVCLSHTDGCSNVCLTFHFGVKYTFSFDDSVIFQLPFYPKRCYGHFDSHGTVRVTKALEKEKKPYPQEREACVDKDAIQ